MKLLMLAALFALCQNAGAENTFATAAADTTRSGAAATDSLPKKKKGIVKWFTDYLANSNKNKKNKKFDFSIIGGPHYDTDSKLGLGLVAAGRYRTDRADTLLPISNVSIYGDVTTVGFYLLGIRGTNIFPHDRYRLDYSTYFFSFPSDFWGIGYEMGNNDDNKSDMKRWQAQIKATFLIRLAKNFYAGPMACYDYVIANEVQRPELLNGMDRHTWNIGAGVSVVYDSRDVLTKPQKGIYINLTQCFRPAFLGNDYAFSTTDFRANAYGKLWKGALLAGDIRSTFNFGNPSWGMMSRLGGSFAMRGYYEGRYRDKHMIETQVELRQHVWRRHGVVAWIGGGTVFDKFSSMRFDHILPNYGIGYRWEFKKDMNVRLDYGFGKNGQAGFMFNINEAF